MPIYINIKQPLEYLNQEQHVRLMLVALYEFQVKFESVIELLLHQVTEIIIILIMNIDSQINYNLQHLFDQVLNLKNNVDKIQVNFDAKVQAFVFVLQQIS